MVRWVCVFWIWLELDDELLALLFAGAVSGSSVACPAESEGRTGSPGSLRGISLVGLNGPSSLDDAPGPLSDCELERGFFFVGERVGFMQSVAARST